MKPPKTVDLSNAKIGQRLKRRDGCITTLKCQGNQRALNYPFFTADGESHLKNGKIYWNLDNDADIIAILPLPKKVKVSIPPKAAKKFASDLSAIWANQAKDKVAIRRVIKLLEALL